jgi:adenylate cyclase
MPRAGLAMVGPSPAPRLTRTTAVTGNLPALEEAVKGLGGIHVSARDDDAVVRRIPVLTAVGDANAIMPSMFIEALRVAQGAQSIVLRSNPDPRDRQIGIPQDVRVGALTLPLTDDGTYRIRYGTPDPSITLSAARVIEAADDPASLADDVGGTIVLVGTSAPGLFDLRATPLGTIVPGVTMHAQAIANIVEGRHLSRPDWTLGLELLMMLIAGLLVIAGALLLRPMARHCWPRRRFLRSPRAHGGPSPAICCSSMPAFRSLSLLVFGTVTVPVLVGTDKRQRFIRTAFSHYLAEPVLARLESNPDALRLEGDRRIITVSSWISAASPRAPRRWNQPMPWTCSTPCSTHCPKPFSPRKAPSTSSWAMA